MEYEIRDQDVLFDDSTNPSLQQGENSPIKRPADQPKLQKAEFIPEEEEQQLA